MNKTWHRRRQDTWQRTSFAKASSNIIGVCPYSPTSTVGSRARSFTTATSARERLHQFWKIQDFNLRLGLLEGSRVSREFPRRNRRAHGIQFGRRCCARVVLEPGRACGPPVNTCVYYHDCFFHTSEHSSSKSTNDSCQSAASTTLSSTLSKIWTTRARVSDGHVCAS